MNSEVVTVSLPKTAWDIIGSALGQMPYSQVVGLINEINRQFVASAQGKATSDREKQGDQGMHRQLLECYLSGQMSERQWQEHLKDEVFLAWLKKNATSETKEGAPTPVPGYVSTSAG